MKRTISIVSFSFQIGIFFISVILLAALFYWPVTSFLPREQFPSFLSLHELKRMEHDARVVVKTGLHIRSFSDFDAVKNSFVFEGLVWFEYNPHAVDAGVLDQFLFKNGEILRKSKPYSKKIDDVTTRIQYDVQVHFKAILNNRDFPIDDHRVAIELVNYDASYQGVLFESSCASFSYADKMFLAGWSIVGHDVVYGFVNEFLHKRGYDENISYQNVCFVLKCMKKDVRHLASILIPLLLILFLTLYCFSLNTDDLYDAQGRSSSHTQTIISVILFAVSTLVAYRFVIESLAPDVSYFILSDYLFFIYLAAVLCIFGLIAQPRPLSARAKKWAMLMLYATIVLLTGLALYL